MPQPVADRRPSDDDEAHFEIRLKGHLSPSWSECFGGLEVINTQSGETILTGPVADQAELHGILAGIRNLNLVLISVTRIESAYRAGDVQDSHVH